MIIELWDLEEKVEDSVYVAKESLTVDQVRKKSDAFEPISELLLQLNDQIEALTTGQLPKYSTVCQAETPYTFGGLNYSNDFFCN